jgi:uncharacterized repeat protein (TIGR03803 family)
MEAISMNRNLFFLRGPRILLLVILIFGNSAMAALPIENILHHFQGGTDGAVPLAGLVADQFGNLYGTTFRGGLTSGLCQADNGCGTVFQLSPPAISGAAWTESVIYAFGPFDHPSAGLVIDPEGNLYGTTTAGGMSGNGTVFQLKPPTTLGGAWSQSTLYSFAGGSDGAVPVAGLALDSKGNLYGTTQFGGGGPCAVFQQGSGCGTVFLLTPPAQGGSWSETVLYSFEPYNDYPEASLIIDSQGTLYGTTTGDQSASFGTVFQLSPPTNSGRAWTQTTLYGFGFAENDGVTPYAGLIFDNQGNLYGTTSEGGVYVRPCAKTLGCGTVFELKRPAPSGGAWTEKVLYNFRNKGDGAEPQNGLTFDKAGNLYGVTGGPYLGFNGTVFKLIRPAELGTPWTEVNLHTFGNGNDGYEPGGPLIFDKGSLLGTTSGGGGKCSFPVTCGTVFELVP